MARKTKIVTIDAEGRDRGKSYLITEMPPRQSEKWATRALLAIGRGARAETSPDMRDELQRSGMAGIAALGIQALTSIAFDDAEPLMDEMLECVTFVPDKTKIDQMSAATPPLPITRALIEEDIEEVSTLSLLRSEVLEVHLGFSIAGLLSKYGAMAKQKITSSLSTPTSPSQSVPSSEEASQP